MQNETMQADPLRVHWWDLKEDETKVLRRTLLSLIVDSIADMSHRDLQCVAQFVDVVQNNLNYRTPAEEFIKNLVFNHYVRTDEGLTPENVLSKLETFRDDFADAVEITKRFNRYYSSIVDATEEEAITAA